MATWRKTSPGKALPLAVVTLLFWGLTYSLFRSSDSPLAPHFWAGRVRLDLLGLGKNDGLFFALLPASAAQGR